MCKFHEVIAQSVAEATGPGLDKKEVAGTIQVAATLLRVQMYIPALNGISGHNPEPLTSAPVAKQFCESGLPKDLAAITAFERQAVAELATATVPQVFSDLGISAGSLGLPSCPHARAKMLDTAADTFFDGDTSKKLTLKREAPDQRSALLFDAVTALLENPRTQRTLSQLFEGSVAKLILTAPAELTAMRKAGIDPSTVGPACHMGAGAPGPN